MGGIDLPDQVAWAEKQGPDQVKTWLRNALSGNSYPIFFADYHDYPPTNIIERLDRNAKGKFGHYLRAAASDLLKSDFSDYATDLLILIGHNEIREAQPYLEQLAITGDFRGKSSRDLDIHQTMLRVLVGFRDISPSVASVLERDFENPEYAPIAYRGLAAYDSTNAIRLLPKLTRISRENGLPYDYIVTSTAEEIGAEIFYQNENRVKDQISAADPESLQLFDGVFASLKCERADSNRRTD